MTIATKSGYEIPASDEARIFAALSDAGWKPKTIYDIGASNGTWSWVMSQIFPEASFEMFEPLAKLLPAYEESLARVMWCPDKFRLHRIALGSEMAEAAMRVDVTGLASTTLDIGEYPGFSRHSVPQHQLDAYVEASGLPLPDLIKLDTQGSELAILSQAKTCLAHASVVFSEVWLTRGYGPKTPLLNELQEYLDRHDYDLAEFGGRFYDGDHRLYSCDALFVKRKALAGIAPGMSRSEAW